MLDGGLVPHYRALFEPSAGVVALEEGEAVGVNGGGPEQLLQSNKVDTGRARLSNQGCYGCVMRPADGDPYGQAGGL